jgi:stage III sporulation protein AH
MKNIFKKNQIIITALAIMIVIAGYLSFTNDDARNDKNSVQTANPDVDELTDLAELDGLQVVTETGDTTTGDTTTDDTTTGDTTADDTNDEDLADDTDVDDTNEDEAANDDDEDTTPVELEDDTEELGDISDDDILATAKDVTDNGELDLEDGVPGEAVLVNALDGSYFISSKLDREQVRARNKETLMDIIESADISEDAKKDALNGMIELTAISEKESAAEMLLEAKGFDGAVVFISDGEVDVVVNAKSLSNQQLAIIEDVVKKKTDVAVEHISITPVVVGD